MEAKMEVFILLLCLSVLSPCLHAGGPFIATPPQVMDVKEGDRNVHISWHVNRNHGSDSLDHVHVNHSNPITLEERLLGSYDGSTPLTVVSGYDLSVQEVNTDERNFTLTIDTVRFLDDGHLKIYLASDSAPDPYSQAVDFRVGQPMERLYIGIHDMARIHSTPSDPLEMAPGTYTVNCSAEGSNPATNDVKLFLNGEAVTIEQEAEVSPINKVRKFSTSITGQVEIPGGQPTLHQMECVAVDPHGNRLVTKVDIQVTGEEKQEVSCQTTKAKEGDKSVRLVCTVDHAKMNVSELAFQVGKTGEMLTVGDDGGNSTGVVTTHSKSATETEVSLTLPKAEGWHFESDFYLIIKTNDGKPVKEPVKLEKGDGDGDTATCPTPLVGLTLLAALLVSYQWL